MDRATAQERKLVQHLLGRLPQAEVEKIEEQLFTDDEFRCELLATADDLIHAYLDGTLAREDRAQFEDHFLASPLHRERVAYIRDLLAALERVSASSVVKAPLVAGSRAYGLRPVWALAAALALAVSGGLLWLVLRPTVPGPRLANATPLPTAPSPVPHEPTITPAPSRALRSPETTRTPPPPPDQRQNEMRVVQLSRQPEGPVDVALDPGARFVRVEVAVVQGPPSFDAILRRRDGGEVWRMEGLLPPSLGKPLVFTIPARLLAATEYILRIEGEGLRGPAATSSPAREYSLRVSRER
jgi:hypothetical protein